MQVLGDLIKLPLDRSDIPLPWWHRAPLGFQTYTKCFVSLIEGQNRPVGDLVVSVLDPFDRKHMLRIECRRRDQPGVVAEATEIVSDFNIALAESITMQAGALHDVTLICEPVNLKNSKPVSPKAIEKKLRAARFERITVEQYPDRHIIWSDIGEVEHGWLLRTQWKDKIMRRYGNSEQCQNIDLTKAVVSADTGERLLRFVFPYKGAKTIKIEHADRPGALNVLTQILVKCNLNLLSTLLRRGGVKPGNAGLLAVCEPKDGNDRDESFERVKAEIENLPPEYMATLRMNDGIDGAKTISPQTPDTVVAHVPSNLIDSVRRERKGMPKGRIPIFFSRRFTNQARAEQIAKSIREVLQANGCIPLEASPENETREQILIFLEVSAKMWNSEAAIVLVVGLEDTDALGINLSHEFGFFQGQTKPILLLVEGGMSDKLREWSNIYGIYAPRFANGDRAFNPAASDSIPNILERWIEGLKGER